MRIYLSSPHMSGFEDKMVVEAINTNYVAPLGPHLDAFESSINNYLGGGLYCVGLSSGTAALHLALRIAGVEESDDVWFSSMTFAGGVFPALYLGANPVFFDLNKMNWSIDISLLSEALAKASKIGKLPKVIVPTDLYGQSCDLEKLESLAQKYDIRLIIDSAESLGALHSSGRKAGSGGDASILSFNGNKIITSSGGGMLVTKHKEWADEARFLATQARDSFPYYQHSTIGYNYRLSNICAAIGLAQMKILDERVIKRREIYESYTSALSLPGIKFMPEPDGYFSSRWLTTLTFDKETIGVSAEDVRCMLLKYQIEARPLWKPMHLQPLFSDSEYYGYGYDVQLFNNGLCLPSGSNMSLDDQNEIIEHILNLIKINS